MPSRVHHLKSKLLLLCLGVIVLQILLVSLLSYGFLSKMSEGIQVDGGAYDIIANLSAERTELQAYVMPESSTHRGPI